MTRRKGELQELDLASWPTVAFTGLSRNAEEIYQCRAKAIRLYAEGDAVRRIEAATKVERRQLYRLLDRCLSMHPDGRIYGFRALIPYQRIAPYQRVAPLSVHGGRNGGEAGSFESLLVLQPGLQKWLAALIRHRRVFLEQVSTEGQLRTRLRGLNQAHWAFLQQCRMLGLSATDYPLRTSSKGIRSLSKYLKAMALRTFEAGARAAGASRMKGLPPQGGG